MMKEINHSLDGFLDEKNLKVLVIGHSGKAFSAGVDVGDHMGDKAAQMLKEFHKIFKKLNKLTCPTIASVKGSALGGGCEVAIFCDMIIASDIAKFGQPEIKVGVFPPLAALVLPQLIGQKKSNELLLLGETIKAEEAKNLGLVNHVIPIDSFDREFNQFINQFDSLSTIVLKYTKTAIKKRLPDKFDQLLDELERYYLEELMLTHDANEGLQAFLEKRNPIWKNR
jgi:cyclohexa-1,5-dienecarbonyl-CoA hydratase